MPKCIECSFDLESSWDCSRWGYPPPGWTCQTVGCPREGVFLGNGEAHRESRRNPERPESLQERGRE